MTHPGYESNPDDSTGMSAVDPIKVEVTNPPKPKPVREPTPEFSSWRTELLTGLESGLQILPQSTLRKRARIMVMPGNAGNVAGYVLVGSQAQVENGQGGRIYYPGVVELCGEPALYLSGDGTNSLSVVISDERYRE